TVRLWRTDTWETVATIPEATSRAIPGGLAFNPAAPSLATLGGWNIRIWDIDVDELLRAAPAPRAVHSTSAKVVLVGEGSAGKSCIALRLAEDRYEELSSTHGMRFWSMPAERLGDGAPLPEGEEREVVLWDLGGQSEYRIIHQLFLDETTVALMVVEPRRGQPALDEIRDWIKRFEVHEARGPVKKLLVGSKLDDDKAPLDGPAINELVRRHGLEAYVSTSARAGSGIDDLKRAIAKSIDWAALSKTTQPELFRRIRREIEQIAAHRVVLPLSELEQSLRAQDPKAYDPEAIRTVVRQLALQGVLHDSRLADGTRALVLRVDHIDRYAGSLIVMARDNPRGIAAIDLAALLSPSIKLPRMSDTERLRRDQELVVLDCVIQLLLERGVCIRHEGLLVFPCLFQPTEHDPIFHHTVALYYEYAGAVDNIYASLVTSLAVSRQFGPVRLWADRAEFSRAGQGTAGVRMSQRDSGASGGTARLDVYFDDGATDPTRELFVGYVEDHLRAHGVDIVERLTMICGGCGFELQEPVVRARREKGFTDIVCSMCEARSPLTFGASEAHARSPDLARRIQALKTTTEDRRRETIAETTVSMSQIQQSQAASAGAPDPPIRILHLSDLHVSGDADPIAILQPLAADLEDRVDGLGVDKLDFLVVSGDITNRASAVEFERARDLVSGIIDRFGLTAERCIIVPGNHDLDWNEPVYKTLKKRLVDPKALKPGSFKEQGDLYEIRDEDRYPSRFQSFSQYFYHPLRQEPYPLSSDQQCIPILSAELGVQFLAMNSAWEIDEYFPERSGIHPGALARGLAEADKQVRLAREAGSLGKDRSVLRIAVWHHPVTGNEKMAEDAFMGNLQKAGVQLCLHGHVHEDRADLIGYLHPTRRVHVVGAGSFGAPAHHRPESVPRLYNVVEVARSSPSIRVHTRCLKKQTGAWEGWAAWPGSRPGEKRTYYEVDIPRA
ncbi:MAG TPA: metallophosphoesterase, partial [Polyangiaceae bacterium]|nr:metallophosphoesterase [Polyangiaceae bacterium]